MRFRARVVWFLLIAAILESLAQARVVQVEVTSRTDIQEGKPFGNAGAYEKIVGRVYFAVDPLNLHNRQIVDLDKAPRTRMAKLSFPPICICLSPKTSPRETRPCCLKSRTG